MSNFTIYPAIDLRQGQVVRLRQGSPNEQTTFSNDPGKIAASWIEAGASWIHVVNLDGAFGEDTAANQVALQAILAVCEGQASVQFGGGLRTLSAIEAALSAGVTRVVLGTAAIEQISFAQSALQQCGPARVAFGLDAMHGELMTHGWQAGSKKSSSAYARALAEIGAQILIFTNISKDGMGVGVDWQSAQDITKISGLQVIASGGVAALGDVLDVKAAGLAGVIIGRALYEKQFSLQEALAC